MKNIAYLVLALMTCFLFSSCITSVNPLITYRNVEGHDAVVGVWSNEKEHIVIEKAIGSEIHLLSREINDKKKTIQQEVKEMKAEERKVFQNAYSIKFYANGKRFFMALLFATINGDLYAQLQPLKAFTMNQNVMLSTPGITAIEFPSKLGSEYLDTYTFAKVTMNKNVMNLNFIDHNFIDKQLKAGTMGIHYEDDDLFENRVITASTEELEKFISKYGKDSRLYDKQSTLVLTRQH